MSVQPETNVNELPVVSVSHTDTKTDEQPQVEVVDKVEVEVDEQKQTDEPPKSSRHVEQKGTTISPPIEEALELYESVLQRNIKSSLEWMEANPSRTYAKLRLYFSCFNRVKVVRNENGKERTYYYVFTDLHYGPRVKVVKYDEGNPLPFWDSFYDRKKNFWFYKMDRSGYSPFQKAQFEYVQKGYYLYDASYVNTGKTDYVANVILSKTQPDTPVYTTPCRYGYIPGLGRTNAREPQRPQRPQRPQKQQEQRPNANANQRYVKQ